MIVNTLLVSALALEAMIKHMISSAMFCSVPCLHDDRILSLAGAVLGMMLITAGVMLCVLISVSESNGAGLNPTP